jgi:hypothetical protein
MSRIIARGGGTPILMEVNDITARKQQLVGLATDLASTVGLGRVVGGTSTPAAVAAAQAAASDMYSDLKSAGTNLKAMAAMLSRRISYMKEFDRGYPSTHATASDARRAGRQLAEKFNKNPSRYYEMLQRGSIDPDFAAGFIGRFGIDNIPALLRDQLRVPPGPDRLDEFERTVGQLIGSATRSHTLTQVQLAALFHDITVMRSDYSLQFPIDEDQFYAGLITGAQLEHQAIRDHSNKALALTRALIDHAVEVADADYAATKNMVRALDLAMAHDGRTIYEQLAKAQNRGEIGGLSFGDVRVAVAVILSGKDGLKASESALVTAIGVLSAEYLTSHLNGAQGRADSIAEFDHAYDELELVMEALSASAAGRKLRLEQASEAYADALKQALYAVFVKQVTALATVAGGPMAGLATSQLGRIDMTGSRAAALAAALDANAGAERAARDMQFAAAKLNFLRTIEASETYFPQGYKTYFEFDPDKHSFVLRPGIDLDNTGLKELLRDKDFS